MKGREHAIHTEISKTLAKIPGIEFWPNNVGTAKGLHGGVVKFGTPGIGDFTVIIGPCGRHVNLEVKFPGEKERPSQVAFRKRMERVGVLCIVATCVTEATAPILAYIDSQPLPFSVEAPHD